MPDGGLLSIEGMQNNRSIIISIKDTGIGIDAKKIKHIFEPFYSGKGEDGRGLGLYIARQLLERHAYSIELADLPVYKRLPGANFVISFIASEEV